MTTKRTKTVRTLPSGAVETVEKGPGFRMYMLQGPYHEGDLTSIFGVSVEKIPPGPWVCPNQKGAEPCDCPDCRRTRWCEANNISHDDPTVKT